MTGVDAIDRPAGEAVVGGVVVRESVVGSSIEPDIERGRTEGFDEDVPREEHLTIQQMKAGVIDLMARRVDRFEGELADFETLAAREVDIDRVGREQPTVPPEGVECLLDRFLNGCSPQSGPTGGLADASGEVLGRAIEPGAHADGRVDDGIGVVDNRLCPADVVAVGMGEKQVRDVRDGVVMECEFGTEFPAAPLAGRASIDQYRFGALYEVGGGVARRPVDRNFETVDPVVESGGNGIVRSVHRRDDREPRS